MTNTNQLVVLFLESHHPTRPERLFSLLELMINVSLGCHITNHLSNHDAQPQARCNHVPLHGGIAHRSFDPYIHACIRVRPICERWQQQLPSWGLHCPLGRPKADVSNSWWWEQCRRGYTKGYRIYLLHGYQAQHNSRWYNAHSLSSSRDAYTQLVFNESPTVCRSFEPRLENGTTMDICLHCNHHLSPLVGRLQRPLAQRRYGN